MVHRHYILLKIVKCCLNISIFRDSTYNQSCKKGHTDGGTNPGRPVRKSHELGRLGLVVQELDEPLTGGRLAAAVAAFEDDEGPSATGGRHPSNERQYLGASNGLD